jgi:hypothetical protein
MTNGSLLRTMGSREATPAILSRFPYKTALLRLLAQFSEDEALEREISQLKAGGQSPIPSGLPRAVTLTKTIDAKQAQATRMKTLERPKAE